MFLVMKVCSFLVGKTGVVTDKSKMILVDEEVSSEEVEHADTGSSLC